MTRGGWLVIATVVLGATTFLRLFGSAPLFEQEPKQTGTGLEPLVPETTKKIIFPRPFYDEDLERRWKAHQATCKEKTIVVDGLQLGGCSYAIRCLLGAVHFAMHTNRTLFVNRLDGTKFVLWEDVFEPISPDCTYPPHGFEIKPNTPEKDLENITNTFFFGCGCPLWNKGRPEFMSAVFMAKAAELVLRMNPKTEQDIMSIISTFPDISTTKYDAIHIRRGDKVFGPTAEAGFIPTLKYCPTVSPTEPVFVAADSTDSIADAKANCTMWTEMWSITDPRYLKLRTGFFAQKTISEWAVSTKLDSFKMFLAELTMMRHARKFVGTGTSNVWQLVYALRGGVNCGSLD